MANYANGTTVEVHSSQLEILRMLAARGIKRSQFVNDDETGIASISFVAEGIAYRLSINSPDATEKRFTHDGRGCRLEEAKRDQKIEAEKRRLWRCLVLVIKAKLVAVEDKVASFEQEFMAYVVVDGNRTMADVLVPRLREMAAIGEAPTFKALTAGSGK